MTTQQTIHQFLGQCVCGSDSALRLCKPRASHMMVLGYHQQGLRLYKECSISATILHNTPTFTLEWPLQLQVSAGPAPDADAGHLAATVKALHASTAGVKIWL